MTDPGSDTQATDPDAAVTPGSGAPHLWLVNRASAVIVLFVLAWQIVIPPFQTPDEPNHLFRAYMLSEGRIWDWTVGEDAWPVFADDEPIAPKLAPGSKLPGDLLAFMEAVDFPRIRWQPRNKVNPKKVIAARDLRVNNGEPRFYGFWNTLAYPPIAYLPQTTVWWLARQINAPVIVTIPLVRLAGFAVFMALAYTALRMLRVLHQPLLLILMSPIAIQQSFAPGPEALVTGAALLFMALNLRFLSKPDGSRLSNRELVLLVVVGILMSVPKMAYFPLLAVSLALPVQIFGSRKRQVLALAATILIPVILIVLWLASFTGTQGSMTQSFIGSNQEAGLRVMFMESPLEGISFMAANLWRNISHLRFWESTYGLLGWYDTLPPRPLAVIFPIMVLVALVMQPSDQTLLPKRALVIWTLVVLGSMAALQGTILAIETYREYELQARYFLPFLPFLLVVAHDLLKRVPARRRLPAFGDWTTLAFSCISLLIMTYVALDRYYGL